MATTTSFKFAAAGALLFSLTGEVAMNSTQPSHMMDMSRDEVRAILKHKMKDISDAQSADLSLRLTQLCDRTGFNLAFVLSVIESESRFRPSVVSNRGAVGLMQLQPTTATFIAPMAGINHAITAQELKNPVLNVTLGVHYLAHLKARFGDSTQVLSAYNMGPAKVQSLRVRARGLAKFSKVRAYVTAIHAGESTIRNQGRKLAHAI